MVEGFNNKAKLTTRKAYGFRTFRAIEVALYHGPQILLTRQKTFQKTARLSGRMKHSRVGILPMITLRRIIHRRV
jgi:hypothetical protein